MTNDIRPPVTIETAGHLIERYIELRDKKQAVTKRFNELLAPLVDEMDQIQGRMLHILQANDLQNIKGAGGTAYQATRTSVKVEDWDNFIEYVAAEEAWHLLERRASKTAATEVLEETGYLPPGLSSETEIVVNFRKS